MTRKKACMVEREPTRCHIKMTDGAEGREACIANSVGSTALWGPFLEPHETASCF